jgi:thiamine pyrophosphate-dependent acetolactate synthase large subunit-like protein
LRRRPAPTRSRPNTHPRRLTDRDTVIVNEGVTNYSVINNHTMCTQPATRFTSGASSLGWNGGAALGMKMPPRKNHRASRRRIVHVLRPRHGALMARKYQARS